MLGFPRQKTLQRDIGFFHQGAGEQGVHSDRLPRRRGRTVRQVDIGIGKVNEFSDAQGRTPPLANAGGSQGAGDGQRGFQLKLYARVLESTAHVTGSRRRHLLKDVHAMSDGNNFRVLWPGCVPVRKQGFLVDRNGGRQGIRWLDNRAKTRSSRQVCVQAVPAFWRRKRGVFKPCHEVVK